MSRTGNPYRAEYARRMKRVREHIDQNIASDLDLKQLAEVAHFSPYHFHRVFAAWMGETLGDYLRRRRLEIGAVTLRRESRSSILAVALEVGFGSGEAFSRAFKLHFGQTPSAWRKEHLSNPDQDRRNLDQMPWLRIRHAKPPSTKRELAMETTLIDLPSVRLAYMRHLGPYGASVGEFWYHKFLPWVSDAHLGEAMYYGISHDDPSSVPAAQCRYDAAVEVPAGFEAQIPVQIVTLPGGRYAVTRFEGSDLEIAQAWQTIFARWLPDSGHQLDARPCFERYEAARFPKRQGAVFVCELCMPVVPL